LGFIVLGFTPEAMGKGNWSVGLIADERANIEQREAITAIASGAAGGPMAALSGLIGKFLGVESAPIRFDRSGAKWSVNGASGLPVRDSKGNEADRLVTCIDPGASRWSRNSADHEPQAAEELEQRSEKRERRRDTRRHGCHRRLPSPNP
jgi:hypothetical protein